MPMMPISLNACVNIILRTVVVSMLTWLSVYCLYDQLEDNFGALEVLPKLTAGVMDEIEGILGNKPTGGPDPTYRTTASKL